MACRGQASVAPAAQMAAQDRRSERAGKCGVDIERSGASQVAVDGASGRQAGAGAQHIERFGNDGAIRLLPHNVRDRLGRTGSTRVPA